MKVLLILTAPSWQHQVRVKRRARECYYAELCELNGASLKAFTGQFRSLDVIVAGAESIHLQLVAMHESNQAAAASQSFREITLNHSAEFSARA